MWRGVVRSRGLGKKDVEVRDGEERLIVGKGWVMPKKVTYVRSAEQE